MPRFSPSAILKRTSRGRQSVKATTNKLFLDLENVHLSNDALGQLQALQKQLPPSWRTLHEIRGYMSTSLLSEAARSNYSRAGITLIDVPHLGRKDAVDKQILVDGTQHICSSPNPRLLLASNDVDFVPLLAKAGALGVPTFLLGPFSGNAISKGYTDNFLSWPRVTKQGPNSIDTALLAKPASKKNAATALKQEKEEDRRAESLILETVFARLETNPIPADTISFDSAFPDSYRPLIDRLFKQPNTSLQQLYSMWPKKERNALDQMLSQGLKDNILTKQGKKKNKPKYSVHPSVIDQTFQLRLPLAYKQLRHVFEQFRTMDVKPSEHQLATVFARRDPQEATSPLDRRLPISDIVKSAKSANLVRVIGRKSTGAILDLSEGVSKQPSAKREQETLMSTTDGRLIRTKDAFLADMRKTAVFHDESPQKAFDFLSRHGYDGSLHLREELPDLPKEAEPLVKMLQILRREAPGVFIETKVLISLLRTAYQAYLPTLNLDWSGYYRLVTRSGALNQAIRSQRVASDDKPEWKARPKPPVDACRLASAYLPVSVAEEQATSQTGRAVGITACEAISDPQWTAAPATAQAITWMHTVTMQMIEGMTGRVNRSAFHERNASAKPVIDRSNWRFLNALTEEGYRDATSEGDFPQISRHLHSLIRALQLWHGETGSNQIHEYILGRIIVDCYRAKYHLQQICSPRDLGKALIADAVEAGILEVSRNLPSSYLRFSLNLPPADIPADDINDDESEDSVEADFEWIPRY